MNDQNQPGDSAEHEYDHGALGDAEYAEFMELAAEEGFDLEDVEGANDPSDPFPTPEKLFTIDDDFNGWGEAADKFFGDGEEDNPLGIITKLQQDTGKVGEE